MNHRPVASGRDRYLAGGSIVGIVALVLVALWLSPLRVDAAPVALNPMAAAGDFTVKTEGDARFDGVEVEGSLAIGGDYTFVGGLPIIHSSGLTPAGYAIPVIDEDPTRLLVRGTFDTAGSSGVSELSSRGNTGEGQLGYVKIGQVGDLQVSARGENNVWIADGPSGAEPGIYDPNQPFSDDPTPAEGSRVQLSETGWDDYFDSLDNTDDVTSCLAELEQNTLIEAGDDANQVQIPITEGVTNVLEVTPDSPLFSAVSVALTAELGPATTLVIKVVDAAGATLTVPRFEAANDTSATNPNVLAPYLLWDLSANAGSPVELTGDKISGSVYAPGVDLTLSQSSPFEGTIISETLHTEASSGELHHYRFLGTIQCEEATPSPTPTSTPTESPSAPTESPSAPTESPSAPTESPSAPTESPSAPTESPSAPTESPSAPTESPSAPTESPSAPTESPSAPTESPSAPTESPSAPTESPSAPTESPSTPTESETTTVATTTDSTTSGSGSSGGGLASTGAQAGLLYLLIGGLCLVVAGAGLLWSRQGSRE